MWTLQLRFKFATCIFFLLRFTSLKTSLFLQLFFTCTYWTFKIKTNAVNFEKISRFSWMASLQLLRCVLLIRLNYTNVCNRMIVSVTEKLQKKKIKNRIETDTKVTLIAQFGWSFAREVVNNQVISKQCHISMHWVTLPIAQLLLAPVRNFRTSRVQFLLTPSVNSISRPPCYQQTQRHAARISHIIAFR